MKAGWKTKPLKDCVETFNVKKKIPKKAYQSEGKFPVVSQEEKKVSGYWNVEDDVTQVDTPVIIYGDHTQVVKLVDFDFVAGADGIKPLKPKDGIIAAYLCYFLQANKVPSLGYARHFRHMKEVLVTVPPLEEQQQIVQILDESFAKLETARSNTAANLESSKELFQSVLNESLSGAEEKGWETKSLGEVCNFENGDRGKNYPGRKAFVDAGVPFINAGHIEGNSIDWSIMNYIPEEHFDRLSKGKVRRNDILFCLRGSLGKSALIEKDTKGAIASSLVIVRANKGLLVKYLNWYFESKFCADEIEKRKGGTAQPNLGATDLKKFHLPYPSLKQQQYIVEKLDSLREQTNSLQQEYTSQLADMDELRQSLLQKAFTGELT